MGATGRGLLETRYYGCCVVDLYNGHLAHAALEGRPPDASPAASTAQANIHSYRWRSHCRGLYQTPIAA